MDTEPQKPAADGTESRVARPRRAAQRSLAFRILLGRNPQFTLVRCIILVAVCLVVFNFILIPVRIQGVSMLPAYRDRSVNFVNRLAYRSHPPRRGDVVAIQMAGKHVMLMKRVIALPGETISFSDGNAYINGKPLNETYVRLPCAWNHAAIQIPTNEYYVIGDNRSMAWEDHEHGGARRDKILGKLLL